MKINPSHRLKKIPPYLFVEIDKAKRKGINEGRDIIDLGVGDPDLPTPAFVIDKLCEAARDPSTHRYALDSGLPRLRCAVAKWYSTRFNVKLDPDTEIYPLIGSKEGIAHLPLAVINPGDSVLVPEPCYPPYRSGVIFAGGKVMVLPLLERNNFLPDLKKIKKAKLVFINYPNNPTAACAERDFYKELIKLARQKGIVVASDLAYSEIYYENKRPFSFLEFEGAKDVGVEFHSLSKTFNMTGWRIGWVCGNAKIISLLAKVKTNIDSGLFSAIQMAGISALESGERFPQRMRSIYQERRDILVEGLNALGWQIKKPRATFYIWAKIPKGYKSSIKFSQYLLKKSDIVVTPGIGFGRYGEGYIRMALTVSKGRLSEAVERIKTRGVGKYG